jgi:hypothetical protein
MRNYQGRGISVISRTEGEPDNSYRDLDNFAYRRDRIQ